MSLPRGDRQADLKEFHAISEAGARNAATALSQMIGRPVHLDVPWARAVPLDTVTEVAGGAARVVCALSLKVYGETRGNLLLIFGEEQVPLLLRLVLGERHAASRDATAELDELQRSALREVGNILAAAYLNAVSRLLGVSLLPSIPGLAIDMAGAVTDHLVVELAPMTDAAVVLASEIREPESGLRGEFLFLPDPGALPLLRIPGREGA
jgi:chemotaxis protein CheC